MPSFNDAIAQLVSILQNDAGLSTFCTDKWGKAHTVGKRFRRRSEINATEYPLIFITRPDVKKAYRLSGGQENENTVRLYCGFQQDDREKVLDEVVEFEEKINDVLCANQRLNETAKEVHPEDSVNDEALYHPSYFIVMDVRIVHRR